MAIARQPLKLTDLPTEILREVLDNFKDARMHRPGRVDWFYDVFPSDDIPGKRQVVQNCRLVCRRFRDLASPLLLPTVRVKLEQSSLGRLDEISRNAAVAAGIQGIEVNLAYRPVTAATDLLVFAHTRNIRSLPHHHRAALECAWAEYLENPTLHDSQLTEEQKLLRESFLVYQRLFYEQEELLQSGAFEDGIAAAASRMPLFGSLLFDDSDIHAGHLTGGESEEDSLFRNMIAANRWRTRESRTRAFLPWRLLADVPVAIHRKGVRLREMSVICFPPMTSWPSLRGLKALRAACQNLEEVNYRPPDNPFVGYTINGLRNLHLYLNCVLSGHSLEALSIDGRGFTGNRGFMTASMPTLKLGPALGTLDGSCLRSIHVGHAAFDQCVWDGLCAGLGWRLEKVSFKYVALPDAGASWRPSLGVLREKTASRCQQGKCVVTLYKLSGGELGDGGLVDVTDWWDRNMRQSFEVPDEWAE